MDLVILSMLGMGFHFLRERRYCSIASAAAAAAIYAVINRFAGNYGWLAELPAYEDRFFAFPAALLFLCLIVSLFYQGLSPAGRRGV